MVGPVPALARPEAIELAGGAPRAAAAPFAQLYQEAVGRVGHYEARSRDLVDRFLSGEHEDVHRLAAASQQAEIAFQLFLGVRNKVVEAYQEVMRMPV
jgi:flagellar hook-basal body complex protein FliE